MGKVTHCKVLGLSAMSCADMAEPMDLPFGLSTRGRPREAQVHLHSPGGANVPTWEGSLAPPGEYD